MRLDIAIVHLGVMALGVGHLGARPQYGSDSLFLRSHYEKAEYAIPMRDGLRLTTVVYTPVDTPAHYPILLIRTPYSAGPYGMNAYRKEMLPSMLLAHEGYIFVYQDVRGRYLSEGEFVNVRPFKPRKRVPEEVDESSDTFDTIAWLLKNLPRSNGKVGITGISYPGFYASMGMIDAHPALVAASPQAPIADWFLGDDDHHHGALFLAETFNFFAGFGRPRPFPVAGYGPSFQHGTNDAYRFFLDMGPLANANALHFRDSIAFWNDLMAHPDYDAFWQERNILPHFRSITPAVMVVGGWFDKEDLYGTLNTYKALRTQSPATAISLVMGPWAHGQWGRDPGEELGDITFGSATSLWYRRARELPFFEYYLKGKGSPPAQQATVFLTGANRWFTFKTWPPSDTVHKALFLRANGTLAFDPPMSVEQGSSTFPSDPAHPVPHSSSTSISVRREYMVEDQRFTSDRSDVLSFLSSPLRRALTIAGPVQVSLHVSTTGSDADWVVKVIDVFPEDSAGTAHSGVPLAGFQMLVRGDVMRGRYRDSFTHPAPFTPGELTTVRFLLQDVFHRFGPRHRLMVQVHSSWFPLVDRNPQKFVNISRARPEDFRAALHTVAHSPGNSSALILPVWEGNPPEHEHP